MKGKTPSAGMAGQVYGYLLERIQSCEYMPGAELNEKRIMDETGFGRTPVREAMLSLQRDGLVEIFPRKGTRVAPFTEKSVNELYEVRKLMEPAVLSMYAPLYEKPRLLEYRRHFSASEIPDMRAHYRFDIEFHSFLVSVTDNSILIKTHRELMTQLFRLAMYAVVLGTSEPEQNSPEHLAIVEALLRENAEEARDALVFHLNHSMVTSLRSIEADTANEETG